MRIRQFSLGAAVLALAACGPSIDITSDRDANIAIPANATYAFTSGANVGEQVDPTVQNDIVHQRIQQSIINQLQAKGFKRVDNEAQADASTKYTEALACGQSWCMYGSATPGTTATYKCKLDATQTRLVNMDGTAIDSADPGTGQKACGACLNNALSELFGGTCTAGSADCEPAACISVTAACLADLP